MKISVKNANKISGVTVSSSSPDSVVLTTAAPGKILVTNANKIGGVTVSSTPEVEKVSLRTGAPGPTGLQGTTGAQGSTGIQGVQGRIGLQGLTGGFGGATFDYTFLANTADTNPGLGFAKLNSNITTAGALYVSFEDAHSANVYEFLQTIDDSTSDIKGTVKISNHEDISQYAIFNITGTHSHGAEPYFSIPVNYTSTSVSNFANGTFVAITFVRTGDKGDQGIQGFTGAQGATGTQGFIGIQGSTGAQGSIGAQGQIGIQGYTGIQGFVGTQGFTGAQGLQGVQGETGIQGYFGIQGFNGLQGTTGSQGIIGIQGYYGIQGVNGTQGTTGTQGLTGTQGVQGSSGTVNLIDVYTGQNDTANASTANVANALYALTNTKVSRTGDIVTGQLTINYNGTGLTVNTNATISNNLNVGNVITSNVLTMECYEFTSNVITSTVDGFLILDTFPTSQYSTVKYIVHSSNIDGIHATELFTMHDGISVYTTEYATLISGSPIGNFGLSILGTDVRLTCVVDNPLNNIVTFKVIRHAVKA